MERVYSSLVEIPKDFQMVDIFRNIDDAIEVTGEAIQLSQVKSIDTIWIQLDILNEDAARRAEAAGINMITIMNHCPAIELDG